MAIKPLADRVLVKPINPDEKKQGGIIIPDTAKEKPQEGEVIEAGPGRTEDGKLIPPTTNFAGAYQHAEDHQGQQDFDLPESWMKGKKRVDLETQLNFVCTADIIGGNSGSPVVNSQAMAALR